MSALPEIDAMVDEIRSAPELFQPSEFWEEWNARNLEQLTEHGFQDFKRTLGRNYFSFVPPSDLRDRQFRAVMRHAVEHPAPAILRARAVDASDVHLQHLRVWRARLRLHALYVAGLWELIRRRDSIGLLDRLVEPSLGNPLLVRHRGRLITEDMCNSALEVLAIVEGLPGRRPGAGGIVEIGGGYGRLAWAFLEAFPDLRYVMVDIPPALAVAERYLTALYPDRQAFRFRHFERPEEVADELSAAQIAFLTPNQLDMLPSLGAAGVVNVSSLHEMRHDQIAHYLQELIPRHAPGGFFYTKQWKRSENRRDGIVVRREDYPVPAAWERVYDRTHPVQVEFFEALYRLP
jgi:putative sugar O-methyltransferase